MELFAGLGGFRLALEPLGGVAGLHFHGPSAPEECVFASEIHPTAQGIYLQNWPAAKLEGDIRLVPTAEIPEHDLLVAGFPCQQLGPVACPPPARRPFSTLGQQAGLKDHRGRLFLHICRVLRESILAEELAQTISTLDDAHYT